MVTLPDVPLSDLGGKQGFPCFLEYRQTESLSDDLSAACAIMNCWLGPGCFSQSSFARLLRDEETALKLLLPVGLAQGSQLGEAKISGKKHQLLYNCPSVDQLPAAVVALGPVASLLLACPRSETVRWSAGFLSEKNQVETLHSHGILVCHQGHVDQIPLACNASPNLHQKVCTMSRLRKRQLTQWLGGYSFFWVAGSIA